MLQRIEFELGPDMRKRLIEALIPSRWSSPACYAAQALLWLAVVACNCLANSHRFWEHASLGTSVALATVYAVAWLQTTRRYSGIASGGSLRLTTTGFTGTLNGMDVSIPWSQIREVRDLGDALVVDRRRGSPVLLPKSSIPDLSALWACLEEHLAGTRRVVRSLEARKRITNSSF